LTDYWKQQILFKHNCVVFVEVTHNDIPLINYTSAFTISFTIRTIASKYAKKS